MQYHSGCIQLLDWRIYLFMREIQLTQGKCAQVDDADYEWLSQWKWNAIREYSGRTWYAVTSVKLPVIARRSLLGPKYRTRVVSMHRLILGVNDPAIEVDHKDRDGLNNQRLNLRQATRAQNARNIGLRRNNITGYKGVSFVKTSQRWKAVIVADHRTLYLGLFDTAEDAARAYDRASREHHGEYGHLNFPEDRATQSARPISVLSRASHTV